MRGVRRVAAQLSVSALFFRPLMRNTAMSVVMQYCCCPRRRANYYSYINPMQSQWPSELKIYPNDRQPKIKRDKFDQRLYARDVNRRTTETFMPSSRTCQMYTI